MINGKKGGSSVRKIDKSSKVPLYLQLSQIIQQMIESGELAEGSYLMPEREICKYQEISRMTVNKAIIKLVNEGYLTRHQGKGTFVAKKKKTSRYEFVEGLTALMNKKGLEVKNKLLIFELQALTDKVRTKLQTESQQGYQIKRLRYLDDEPAVLETIYLSQDMCPDLNKELIQQSSLYEIYQKRYHHRLLRAEQIIKPILLTKDEAKLLGQLHNTLALKIDRVVYTTEETIMEYTSSIFLSQKYDFEVVLTQPS